MESPFPPLPPFKPENILLYAQKNKKKTTKKEKIKKSLPYKSELLCGSKTGKSKRHGPALGGTPRLHKGPGDGGDNAVLLRRAPPFVPQLHLVGFEGQDVETEAPWMLCL